MIEAVLFDLDGTFADTVPDLGGALNRLRVEEGLAELPLTTLRPYTSHGVRGLLGAGFGVAPGEDGYAELARRFLAHYENALCAGTQLFPGMADLIEGLEARGVRWGVVTNKTSRYTLPVLAGLGVARRAACIVSGDSAPRAKPYPDPLLLAAAVLQTEPACCIYVGDDLRDVEAGRAAGIATVAAAYGYLGANRPVNEWGADRVIQHPAEVLGIVAAGAC